MCTWSYPSLFVQAPTGAGTPVSLAPGVAPPQDFDEKILEKAAAAAAAVEGKGEEVKGDGAWKMQDVEAQQVHVEAQQVRSC